MKKIRGFTLIELMIVVVIVAIFAAITFPSYQQYTERRDLAIARQEALRIAAELERFKAKNFSYKGFDASYLYTYAGTDADGNTTTASYYDAVTGQLLLPIGSTAYTAKFILTLANGGTGHKPLTFVKDSDGNETADSASVNGLTWVMLVQRAKDSSSPPKSKQPRNYDLLITSTGIRCMTRTEDVVTDYTNCGTSNSESW